MLGFLVAGWPTWRHQRKISAVLRDVARVEVRRSGARNRDGGSCACVPIEDKAF